MLNRVRITVKDIKKSDKFYDNLDMKKDLFREEEIVTVPKGIKNDKVAGAKSVINEFFLNMVVVKLEISY